MTSRIYVLKITTLTFIGFVLKSTAAMFCIIHILHSPQPTVQHDKDGYITALRETAENEMFKSGPNLPATADSC